MWFLQIVYDSQIGAIDPESPNVYYQNVDNDAYDLWNNLGNTFNQITGKNSPFKLLALWLKTSKLVLTWDSQVTQNVNEGTEDVTGDAEIIARQSDKICHNLRDQTWTWPNAQHLKNQDFSRLGLKFRDYIPRNSGLKFKGWNSGMIGIMLRL